MTTPPATPSVRLRQVRSAMAGVAAVLAIMQQQTTTRSPSVPWRMELTATAPSQSRTMQATQKLLRSIHLPSTPLHQY